MSRSIQIGDFVSISLEGYLQYYRITDISNTVDPKEILAIEYKTEVPKIYGIDYIS